MGMGTSGAPAIPEVPGAPTAPAATPGTQKPGSGLTDNQIKAITMLMSNLGKTGQNYQGIGTPQGQGLYPQTSTLQGGTYFNPSQQR
ncbi:hypothetical protein [Massilia suwonensis]|uniref:Uncharacterized protein n=1 Tax=Massilia suwonensis TaxID=648895 RepID=A0ABW0MI18_9BURK